MLFTIGLVFIVFCVFLKLERAFFLAFFLQNTFYLAGSLDIGTYCTLIVFLRLVIYKKGVSLKLFLTYHSVRLLFVWLALSVLWSLFLGEDFVSYLRAILRCIIGLYVFISLYQDRYKLNRLWLFLIPLGVNLLNTTLIYNNIHPFIQPFLELGRLSARGITGEHVNINTLAYSILSLFIALIFVINIEEIKNKVFIGGITIYTLIVFGYFGSRFVIIALLLVLGSFYLNKKTIILLLLSSLLLYIYIDLDVGGVTIPFIGEEANERIRSIGNTELSETSGKSRMGLAKVGWKLFIDNFVLGVGTGAIRESMSAQQYLGKPVVPHNAYLSFLIQFGFFGGIIIIYRLFKIQLRIWKQDFVLGVCFFALFILSSLSHDYFQVTLVWMLMFLFELKANTLRVRKRLYNMQILR